MALIIMPEWCLHDDCARSTDSFATPEAVDAHDVEAHLFFCSVEVAFPVFMADDSRKFIKITMAVRDTVARARKCEQYVIAAFL